MKLFDEYGNHVGNVQESQEGGPFGVLLLVVIFLGILFYILMFPGALFCWVTAIITPKDFEDLMDQSFKNGSAWTVSVVFWIGVILLVSVVAAARKG